MWFLKYEILDNDGGLDFISIEKGAIHVRAVNEDQVGLYWIKVILTDLYLIPMSREYIEPIKITHSKEYTDLIEEEERHKYN